MLANGLILFHLQEPDSCYCYYSNCRSALCGHNAAVEPLHWLPLPPGSAHSGVDSEGVDGAASLDMNSGEGRRAACSPECVHAAAALSRKMDDAACVICRGGAVCASCKWFARRGVN